MGFDSQQDVEESGLGAVTVKEAARLLRVSTRTIWRMVADGQLAPVRFRRCTRIALSQLSPLLKGAQR